jgi:DNA-binding winged helix-turn-helix (wHTH) protein
MSGLLYSQASYDAVPVLQMPVAVYRLSAQVNAVHGRRPVRFGDFTVDPLRHVLTRSGQELHLEPRGFALLSYLIERRDRVVSKTELLDALWPSIHVSESVVARCVMKVRATLGGGPDGAEMIKTVHRVGYRFVAAIHGD